MKLIDVEQNTPEWFAFRKGKIGGSRLASIWSTRQYTVADVEKLLTSRGVSLEAFQQELNADRRENGLKSKKYTKADLETLLTPSDKDQLSIDSEKRIEYYQVLADQLTRTPEGDEAEYRDAMDRGHQLEGEACSKAAEVLDKTIMAVGCIVDDDEERIYTSPDRIIVPKEYDDQYIKVLEEVNSGKLKIREEMEAKCLKGGIHLWAYFERQVPESYFTQKVQYFIANKHLETLYFVFYHPLITMLPLFVIKVRRKDLGHWPDTLKKYQKRTLKELDGLAERLFDESDQIVFREKVNNK